MADINVGKACRIEQLHDELVAAGHGAKVITVRGTGDIGDGVAASGEIEHDGSLLLADAQSVIDAHVPVDTNKKKIQLAQVTTDMQTILNLRALVVANTATANQQRQLLALCAEYVVKIAKYLRNEAIS